MKMISALMLVVLFTSAPARAERVFMFTFGTALTLGALAMKADLADERVIDGHSHVLASSPKKPADESFFLVRPYVEQSDFGLYAAWIF